MCILEGLGQFLNQVLMSRIDSLLNLSPLYTLVSRNVISFSEISAVNFIMEWNASLPLFCLRNIFMDMYPPRP